MKFSLAALALASMVSGQELMAEMMSHKTFHRQHQIARGVFDANKYDGVSGFKPCVDGKAGEYSCSNVDMYGFLSHEIMGSPKRQGNDVWGWTSPDGREFGAVGQVDGTAFVEVKPDGSLEFLGRLPTQTVTSIWRDIKIIDGYAYIGSEAKSHGMQVFDMRKLLEIKPIARRRAAARIFDVKKDLTAWYSGFGNSHNIVAHPEKNMIYAVGTGTEGKCKGGLYMVDVSTPSAPKFAGCFSEDGYTHDAQCVTYSGPDTKYTGKEICFAYNEDTLTIVDATNPSKPVQLSKTGYNGASYTHQGWLIDPVKMNYLMMDDELDEVKHAGLAANNHTTSFIVDISSLEKPVITGTHQSPAKAIDHNQYVKDGLVYQSNYGSGLRIVDVSSVQSDPTGKSMNEVGFFDVYPEDDAENGVIEYNGSWSVYPYFKSGYLLVNSIERGIYSLKYKGGK